METLEDAGIPQHAEQGDLVTVGKDYARKHLPDLLDLVREGAVIRVLELARRVPSVVCWITAEPPESVLPLIQGDVPDLRELTALTVEEAARLACVSPSAMRHAQQRVRASGNGSG